MMLVFFLLFVQNLSDYYYYYYFQFLVTLYIHNLFRFKDLKYIVKNKKVSLKMIYSKRERKRKKLSIKKYNSVDNESYGFLIKKTSSGRTFISFLFDFCDFCCWCCCCCCCLLFPGTNSDEYLNGKLPFVCCFDVVEGADG